MTAPAIYFYYPPGAPDPDAQAASQPRTHSLGRPGNYIWTVRTCMELTRHGVPCTLTDRMPDEGIIVTHRQFLPDDRVPRRHQLFVCAVADFRRHPYAQLHVVQNPRDPVLVGAPGDWNAVFMPHWPETELAPRHPGRKDLFTRVSYFGLPERLAPQLRSAGFAARLRDEGLEFSIMPRQRWNDYSDTDAVLAVRSFAPVSFHKFPPTKLYNSWLAGVPALLGRESAYQAERRGELDYFEMRRPQDVIDTLIRLRDDPALRAAVAGNCAARAAEVSPARIAEHWRRFLEDIALPAYERWRSADAAVHRAFRRSRRWRYRGFLCADLLRRGGGYARKQLDAWFNRPPWV